MKSTLRALLVSAVAAVPSLAAADGVSDADAKAIEAKLLSLVAKDLADSGALSVKAAGDRYEVLFDLRKALEKSIAPWTIKEANSILHALRPPAAGLWEFSGQGGIRFSADVAAASRSGSVTLTIGSFENKGVFDETLRFLRSGEFKAGDLTFGSRAAKDNFKIVASDYALKLGFAEKKPGSGDISADVAAHGLAETFGAFPNPETRLAGNVLTGRFLFEDVDLQGIGRLADFWSGRAKGKTIETLSDAERAALCSIIATHAPFARQLGEDTRVEGVSVRWAGTVLAAENLVYHWGARDLGGDAVFEVGAKVAKLTVDSSALPPAVKKALPREIGFGLRYSGFKFSALWAGLSDPKTIRESLTTKDYYTRRILPEGRIQVSFDGTYIRSDHYDITLSGGMAVPLDNPRKPEMADLTVTARDFDKTIKFLQDIAREDPQFTQMSFTALVIKGFGKVQPDGSVLWHLKTDANGKMTVNGQPVPMK